MGLDKTQYGQFVAKVINNERDNIGIFPPTIQAVIDGCKTHVSIMTSTIPTMMYNQQPTVYGLSVKQAKRPCHNCN